MQYTAGKLMYLIRQKCKQCCNGSKEAVAMCKFEACPLYEVRLTRWMVAFLQREKRSGNEKLMQKKAIQFKTDSAKQRRIVEDMFELYENEEE